MEMVRCCYIICSMIEGLILLALAVAAPIWITPGYYWWSVIAFMLMTASSDACVRRMNSWGWLGDTRESK